jgi:hypothetical protein
VDRYDFLKISRHSSELQQMSFGSGILDRFALINAHRRFDVQCQSKFALDFSSSRDGANVLALRCVTLSIMS